MEKQLSDFKALTFDCYGTLIDWESGIWDALQPLLMHNACSSVHRDLGLQAFAKLETEQERDTPDLLYPLLLTRVHRAIADHFELKTNNQLDDAFGNSVPMWPAFADSADALRILKRHFKLVILSNVNRDGFAASQRKLGVEFDAIYTAQDVGSYKPNAANFAYMSDHLRTDLGIENDAVLHRACITTMCRLECTDLPMHGLTGNGYRKAATGALPQTLRSVRNATSCSYR
jgi:2-haloacid dehalogenase